MRCACGSCKPIRAIAIECIELTTHGGADEAQHGRRACRFHLYANKSGAQASSILDSSRAVGTTACDRRASPSVTGHPIDWSEMAGIEPDRCYCMQCVVRYDLACAQPRLSARNGVAASQHENCMEQSGLDSEQPHEPDQPGYPHAALADVGGRNRQHHRDRTAAWPHPTRDHASIAAAGGTHRQGDLRPRGPAAVSHRRRRDRVELRAVDRRRSRRNAVAARLPRHRRSRRARHARPLRGVHAAGDPQDLPQSFSARAAGAELLALDAAGRMREARRSRYRAGDPDERFHRRTGGAPGATDLDDWRAIHRAQRKADPAGAAAAGQHFSRSCDRGARSRKAAMAHCLRQPQRQRLAGRGLRRHGGDRPRPLRAGAQHARDRRK